MCARQAFSETAGDLSRFTMTATSVKLTLVRGEGDGDEDDDEEDEREDVSRLLQVPSMSPVGHKAAQRPTATTHLLDTLTPTHWWSRMTTCSFR